MPKNSLREVEKDRSIRVTRDYSQVCGAITAIFIGAKVETIASIQNIWNIGLVPIGPHNDCAINFADLLALLINAEFELMASDNAASAAPA